MNRIQHSNLTVSEWGRRFRLPTVSLSLLAALCLISAAPAQTGFPFQNEALHYTINYSSGLSLGDANLSAHKEANGWDFAVTVDAAVAGFTVKDKFTASSNLPGFCSTEFLRDTIHGSKTTREKTTFDQDKQTAHRETEFPSDGGSSDLATGPCGRDAISFLYFARKELGQGRVPPPQVVYFGSPYTVQQSYTGAQSITIDKKPEVTDHLVFAVKGPKSDFSVEVFYARDAARTPLLIKIPQAVGTLSMELVR